MTGNQIIPLEVVSPESNARLVRDPRLNHQATNVEYLQKLLAQCHEPLTALCKFGDIDKARSKQRLNSADTRPVHSPSIKSEVVAAGGSHKAMRILSLSESASRKDSSGPLTRDGKSLFNFMISSVHV